MTDSDWPNDSKELDKLFVASLDSIKAEGESGKLFFVEECPGADLNRIKSRIDEFALDIVVINGVYFLKDVGSKKIIWIGKPLQILVVKPNN